MSSRPRVFVPNINYKVGLQPVLTEGGGEGDGDWLVKLSSRHWQGGLRWSPTQKSESESESEK